jgi:phosphatidylinositol alpha-1,6-mannosyltransferase
MQIGIVAPEFPPSRGGIQTYSVEVARELARRGHNLTVFVPQTSTAESHHPFSVVAKLQLNSSADEALLRQHQIRLWHGMNAACAWIRRLGAPSTISAHGNDLLSAYVPFFNLNLKRRFRLPWGSRLDAKVNGWWGRRELRRNLPHAAHIFVNSRYTQSRLEAEHPHCRGRASVAGVGVAAHFFASPLRTERNQPTKLVSVARLDEPRKNIVGLIEAASHIPHNFEFELSIIGEGRNRADLEEYVRKLRLGAKVRLLGDVTNRDLIHHLSTADLFVLAPEELPCSFEGFGLVYLEANASGTPVLAVATGGAAEAVRLGTSGFFADSPRPKDLAKALHRFLAGEIHFDRDACRQHAANYTWTKVVDHMEPILLSQVAC